MNESNNSHILDCKKVARSPNEIHTQRALRRRKVERQRDGVIIFGEPLTQEYKEILNLMDADAPEGFQNQARLSAYIFSALDSEVNLVDEQGRSMQHEIEKLAHRLSHAPFVGRAFFRHKEQLKQQKIPPISSQTVSTAGHSVIRRKVKKRLDPNIAFPFWISRLRSAPDFEVEGGGNLVEIPSFYKKWVIGKAEPYESKNHQTYYRYSPDMCPPKSESPASLFKAYLEYDCPVENLEAVFRALSSDQLHPHVTKMFDRNIRMVMYWTTHPSAGLTDRIIKVFQRHNVKIRGFAQDSRVIIIDDEGNWQVDSLVSNDEAMSSGKPIDQITKNKYDPSNFFRLYLEQCYQYGRNPLDPYMMSFVCVSDRRDNQHVSIIEKEKFNKMIEIIESEGLEVFKGDRFGLFEKRN